MAECFGAAIAGDKVERNHRFLEEALELVQAAGCTKDEALRLVAYVYGRPVGELGQEVGGVMVTLAALCLAQSLDMHAEGERELERIWTKIETIRAKQAAKPKGSPLPQAANGVELLDPTVVLARLEELRERLPKVLAPFIDDLKRAQELVRRFEELDAREYFVGVKGGKECVTSIGDSKGDAKTVELYLTPEAATARFFNVRRARLIVGTEPVRPPESWGAIDGE